MFKKLAIGVGVGILGAVAVAAFIRKASSMAKGAGFAIAEEDHTLEQGLRDAGIPEPPARTWGEPHDSAWDGV